MYEGAQRVDYGSASAIRRDSRDRADDAQSRFEKEPEGTLENGITGVMKAMLKSELAAAAGVSRTTFRRWLKSDAEYLREQGVKTKAKMLPPKVVKYLIEKYCI